jgi:uncharacterized integral membrane protein
MGGMSDKMKKVETSQIHYACHSRLLILISIYLSTAIGLTAGGSSTVHIYTQTIHRTTQLTKQYEQQQKITNNKSGRVLAVPNPRL